MTTPKSVLYIDSRFRDTDLYSIEEFTIDFKQKYSNVTAIELQNVNMTNSFYNIDSDNNKLYFDDISTTARTATLNSSFYDTTTILTEIDRAMDATASSDTYTSSYDSLTGKITIAVDTGGVETYILNTATTDSAIWDTIGYTEGSDVSAGTTHVANNVLDLENPRYIDVRSRKLGSMLDGNGEVTGGVCEFSDILYRVKNDATALHQHIPQNPNDTVQLNRFQNAIEVSQMDFCLTNSLTAQVIEPNGHNYNFELVLHHGNDEQTGQDNRGSQPVKFMSKSRR